VRAREDTYAGHPIGSGLVGAAAAGVRLFARRTLVGVETWGGTAFASGPFASATSPVEAIVSVHHALTRSIRIGLGAGGGITAGLGAPRTRILATIEWAPPYEAPDRDDDGIDDGHDACPDAAGPRDSDDLVNGCPPPPRVPAEDADGDGVSDMEDACPATVGLRTSDPMTNGCPRTDAVRPLAVATSTEIRIGEEIRFQTASAELLADSDDVLDAVRKILGEHPEIRRIRIEGHTDAVGDPAFNEELSAKRARAVSEWLIGRGVEALRIESKGYGATRPIASNESDEGRARNRRVVFVIVERAAR